MERYILTNEDIKPILTLVKYNCGNFNNEKFGLVKVDGELYALLGDDGYPSVEAERLEEIKKWLEEWVKKLGSFIAPNDSYYDKFLQSAENSLYLVPTLRWPTKEFKAYIKYNAIFWYVDDFLDNIVEVRTDESLRSHKFLNDLGALAGKIFNGDFKSPDDIKHTKQTEPYKELCKVLFLCYKEAEENSPHYQKRCQPLVKAMANWVRHHGLHLSEESKMWRSEFTHMLIRRQNGYYPCVELFVLLSDVEVSPEVRNDALFNVCYESCNDGACWSNDCIGIKKEIDFNEYPGNLALRKSVLRDVPVNDCIKWVDKLQRQRMTDYLTCKQELLLRYPDDKQLRKFLYLNEVFADGSTYMYLNAKRYGPKKTYYHEKVFEN